MSDFMVVEIGLCKIPWNKAQEPEQGLSFDSEPADKVPKNLAILKYKINLEFQSIWLIEGKYDHFWFWVTGI